MNARTLFGYFTGRTRPISPRSDFTVQTISLIPRLRRIRLPALFLFLSGIDKFHYVCYHS